MSDDFVPQDVRPYERARVGPLTTALLVILRIYVSIAVPIAVYAFGRNLH